MDNIQRELPAWEEIIPRDSATFHVPVVGSNVPNEMRDLLKRFTGWLQSPGESFGRRVIHGGIWASLLNLSERGLKIGRLIIVATLLSPEDFGLLGIALLVITVTEQFLNFGIDSALVQKDINDLSPFLGTAWSLKLIRGVGIFCIIILLAPLVGGFFHEPRAVPIIRVIALSVVLRSFINPAVIYFRKDLEFHREFVFKLSGATTNFAVAIIAAYYLRSVWALVYGIIAGNFVQVLVSHRLPKQRPNLSFSWKRGKEMLRFGKWIWATTVVVFLATSGDDAFVGWYLGTAALGYYQMAFRLANAPSSEVTGVISSVMFPAYSKLQNDKQRLQVAFQKTIRLVFLVAIPASVGIILVSRPFTLVVLGPEWVNMVAAMQVIAVGGLFRAIVGTGGALFTAYGSPDWDFRMNAVRVIAIALTILPLTERFGIAGAALSITIGIGLTLPIWLYISMRITGLSRVAFMEAIFVPLSASVLMALPVILLKENSLLRLALAVIAGIIVYSISAQRLYRYRGWNPINELRKLAR